jgi:tetratricopeptide (TPR) repeat protein
MRYEEALAAFEQAIRLNPNYAAAYTNKGNALKGLNKKREAKLAYDKARQLGYGG